MDKKKGLDLIKLEVLGCLSDKDKENLQAMKTEVEEFPWKELGDYQNLIAILPLAQEIKYPASDLKDKTAMKLYNIKEQIKAKVDAKKALEMPEEPVEEIAEFGEEIEVQEQTEENITTEQIEVEEKEFVEVEEGIHLDAVENIESRDEPPKFVSNFKERSEPKSPFQPEEEIETSEPLKTGIDKNEIEKVAREYIKSHLERELESIKSSVNKNKMLSFILFAVAIILIIAMYFIK